MSKKFGSLGERLAREYLEGKGYKCLFQNFWTKFGEIDLVFLDGEELVFVEVKARHKVSQGLPEEAVNRRKVEKISRVAEFLMQENPQLPQRGRIEVVGVDFSGGSPTLRHIENVGW